MAEEKRITISRTLNGDTIYYIARNSSGTVFARELTLEKLQKAIKTYREPPPVKEEGEAPVEAASAEGSGEPKKTFLANKLSEKVQKRKKEQEEQESKPAETAGSAKKKSFWDRLK